MFRLTRRAAAALLVSALCLAEAVRPAAAETDQIRIGKQYGLAFLPLIVMENQKMYEKRAAALGIPTKPVFVTMGNNTAVNEALISGNLDIVTNGPPGFLTVWSRTKGTRIEVKGVTAMLSQSSWLNTRKPGIRSVRDFTSADRIALSAVKISIPAIILQMAAAQAFGQDHYDQLDKLTVSLPHPDGMSSMLSGKTEISAHFTSPPFQEMEVKSPGIHTILTSEQVMGGPSTWSVLFATARFKEANPKALLAFVQALGDAIDFVKNDKDKAADIYLAASKEGGAKKSDVVAMLNDPSIIFTKTPQKIMAYAEFMKKVGTLKIAPKDWKEPFFKEYVDNLPGD